MVDLIDNQYGFSFSIEKPIGYFGYINVHGLVKRHERVHGVGNNEIGKKSNYYLISWDH